MAKALNQKPPVLHLLHLTLGWAKLSQLSQLSQAVRLGFQKLKQPLTGREMALRY